MVTQALFNVKDFAKGQGGELELHTARKLHPRAGPQIKLLAQCHQAAGKGGQEHVKCKANLLQMYSPFHDALEYKRFPGQFASTRGRIAQLGLGAPTQSCLLLPVATGSPWRQARPGGRGDFLFSNDPLSSDAPFFFFFFFLLRPHSAKLPAP